MNYHSHSKGDRRKFQRLKINLTVWYTFFDKEVEATTLDLSEGGIAFIAKHSIPVGTLTCLTFSLFKTGKDGVVKFSDPVAVTAEVRSNFPISESEFRLGLSFKSIDQKKQENIAGFVKEGFKRPA